MSPKKEKSRGKLGTLFAVGGSVTLTPVLIRRFKEARAKGDKLAVADVAVSAAALAVGVLQALRARKSSESSEPSESSESSESSGSPGKAES
ncbi:MAG: hypothetical protein AUG49_24875 [Catenulispora sp. 13_1_20CM_3_70_7]|nr:hypothetical protein [Catenulisporales bacterium]OLE20499.1 MAG: hypothetical protein AUG49_24875 [Catenulispora sp. 13_1_20CM_3_70_7]